HGIAAFGAKLAPRLRFPDRVTVDTGSGKETVAAGPRLWIVHRRLPLGRRPLFEIPRRVHDHAEQHVCVLHAAIFGAVTNIDTRFYWLDPHTVFPIGNHIGFPGELRHPETMHDIRG